MKISKKKYYLIYTAVFAACFYFCFYRWFQMYNKTMFRSFDGIDQHYLIFLYIGKWFRSIYRSIVYDHKFIFPMWNMGIGYGSDILTSLGAYLPDPFNWISTFFPSRYAEFGYALMITLKVWCSGAAFSFLALRRENKWQYALAGSVVYAFSATMYVIFIESFLINPMYIFPFVVAGIDDMWEKKTSKLYVFSLAFSFINYFYFGYMTCIFIAGYFIIKYITDKKLDGVKTFFQLVWKFFWNSVIGVAISAVVLLPIMLVMVNAGRLGVNYYRPLFYTKNFYQDLISGFIGASSMMSGRDCFIGYTVLSALGVALLFSKRQKFARLKVEFIGLSIGLGLPLFGSIMNGFSYYANRWVWAYALLVAYIVTETLPLLPETSSGEKFGIVTALIVYACIITIGFGNFSTENVAICFFLFAVIIVLLGFIKYVPKHYANAVLVASMAAVMVTSTFYFSVDFRNSISNETDKGTALNQVMESGAMPLLSAVGATPNSRYDEDGIDRVRNASWLYGISGEDLYISIYNNNIDTFHNDIGMLTTDITNGYMGMNRRSILEHLFGVNHYFIREGDTGRLPYDYNIQETTMVFGGGSFSSYAPEKSTSLFHGFKDTVGVNDFKSLSPYQKQNVLAEAIVYNDSDKGSISGERVVESSDVIPFTEDNINIIRDGETYSASDGAEIDLSFETIENSEIYVYLEGLDYENGDSTGAGLDFHCFLDDTEAKNSVYLGISNYKTHMYGDKHNWLINTGYSENGVNKIKIFLSAAGNYTLTGLTVYAAPAGRLEELVNSLNNVCLNSTVSGNMISADLNVNNGRNQILLSVPYSSGWKLKVDGKEQDIRLVDDAFMGFSVDDGNHHVELRYITPGLLPGLALSLMSLVFYLCLCGVIRRSGCR